MPVKVLNVKTTKEQGEWLDKHVEKGFYSHILRHFLNAAQEFYAKSPTHLGVLLTGNFELCRKKESLDEK